MSTSPLFKCTFRHLSRPNSIPMSLENCRVIFRTLYSFVLELACKDTVNSNHILATSVVLAAALLPFCEDVIFLEVGIDLIKDYSSEEFVNSRETVWRTVGIWLLCKIDMISASMEWSANFWLSMMFCMQLARTGCIHARHSYQKLCSMSGPGAIRFCAFFKTLTISEPVTLVVFISEMPDT